MVVRNDTRERIVVRSHHRQRPVEIEPYDPSRYLRPMRLIGLTGGIGSGKSSVSSRLEQRGAELIDADAIVRELQAPGQPVFDAMVERWGDRIVADDGTLDRAAVAGIVFSDKDELKAIEAIVHPELRQEMDRRIGDLATSDRVVILDIPLLAESRSKGGALDARGTSAIIVVDCPIDTAVARLVEHRGFDEADARARVAAQATREDRRALADFVIDNGGAVDALEAEIDRCWSWLASIESTPWPPEPAAPSGSTEPSAA
jgi:dephospho-CoA kinase